MRNYEGEVSRFRWPWYMLPFESLRGRQEMWPGGCGEQRRASNQSASEQADP